MNNKYIKIGGPKKYSCDLHYFDVFSDENCYFAGFYAADGCLSVADSYVLACSVQNDDKEILSRFKSNIKYTGIIEFIKKRKINHQDQSRLQITVTKEFFQTLKDNFNLVPQKTYILLPPYKLIQESYIANFIRGYLDGDGCISFDTNDQEWKINFLGTEKMLLWIKQCIQKYSINCGNPSILKTTGCYRLDFCGRQTHRILNWIYQYSNYNTRLKRKYEKYKELVSYYVNNNGFRGGSSSYKGVFLDKRYNKWYSYINFNKKRYNLGYFLSEKDAAIAYNNKSLELKTGYSLNILRTL